MSGPIILDLCGGTGSWSNPYKEAGYDVRLITLPKYDVRLFTPPKYVYGILAAPPCNEFSIAKFHHGKGNYSHNFLRGLEIVAACCRIILTSHPTFWCIENPGNSLLRRWLGKPKFTFHPWQYGEDYAKLTGLWGDFNIPQRTTLLQPENIMKFHILPSKNVFPEYSDKYSLRERRSITPKKFAEAFFEANKKEKLRLTGTFGFENIL